jgi:hypothetical protein
VSKKHTSRIVAVILLVFAASLISAGGLLAQRTRRDGGAGSGQGQRVENGPGSDNQNVAPASATRLAKEYVYAGGRLIATEEPASTPSCSFSINPTSRNHTSSGAPSGGGASTVAVSTSAGCNWTAASNAFWVEITSGTSGSGPGAAGYSVEPSLTYGCRSGRLTIAGQDFTVNETGQVADSDCDGIPDSVEPVEGRNSNLKDNDVFAIARLFVMQQYRDFFWQEGDSGGIQFWTNAITSGSTTRAGLADTFIRSDAFQNTAGAVTRLYLAYFLRAPDYGGGQFWLNSLRVGVSLEQISQSFAQSAEFIQRYGNLTNSEFVMRVYQNVLEREPDAGGLAFWRDPSTGRTRIRW